MNRKLPFTALLLAAPAFLHAAADGWQGRAPANLLSGRSTASAVWTGTEMIVFGGEGMGVSFADGARYHFASDSWRRLPYAGAPSSRTGHTAVWTGQEMIIWGGFGGLWGRNTNRYDGARYSPFTDTWSPVSTINAPPARFDHTAVWTGTEMLVWGGFTDGRSRYAGGHANAHLHSGGRYYAAADTWRPITLQGAPSNRCWHSAVWTGKEMIIWGGGNATKGFNDGGRYDPVTDTWKPISLEGAPSPRVHHVAVWADALGGLVAPEVGHPGLEVGVAGEVLAVDDHRLAADELAARGGRLRQFGHGNLPFTFRARPRAAYSQ